MMLFAVTVKVYATPFVRLETTQLVVGAVAVHVRLPGEEVTVYEEILAPPLETGAVQLTVAFALPVTALTEVGAPGTFAGVAEIAPEETPEIVFTARIWTL
jgi:hypothetical protein